MDTSIPPPIVPPVNDGTSPVSMQRIGILVLGVFVLLAIAVFAWWRLEQKRAQEARSAADLGSSLNAITATTSASVPTTANPLKSATPAVNPIEKTNPFNNEYKNPFQ